MDVTEKKVATAVRLEVDENKDDVYIVFLITDEQFKQKVRENWLQDLECKLINKSLVRKGK